MPGVDEVDAVVGEHGVDFVRDGFEEGAEEVGGHSGGGFFVQLDEGELGCSVDGDQEIELSLLGADFGDVDVEVAERMVLELALVWRAAPDIGQTGDAVPPQAAVQR